LDLSADVCSQENGEHVVSALGELHLEQCLKVCAFELPPTNQSLDHYISRHEQDLRVRYARVEIRVSAPLVTYKETVCAPLEGEAAPAQLSVPPWCEEEGQKA
jgi:translation elongation factor EF-G